MLIAVTIAALAVASNIVMTDFLRSRQPRGEILDYYVSVDGELLGNVRRMKVTLIVSCSGPRCDGYSISTLFFWGLDRSTGNQRLLHIDNINKALRAGATRVDSLVYVDASFRMNELIIAFIVRKPDGSSERVVRSVSIG